VPQSAQPETEDLVREQRSADTEGAREKYQGWGGHPRPLREKCPCAETYRRKVACADPRVMASHRSQMGSSMVEVEFQGGWSLELKVTNWI
jgi:hypothetical protein